MPLIAHHYNRRISISIIGNIITLKAWLKIFLIQYLLQVSSHPPVGSFQPFLSAILQVTRCISFLLITSWSIISTSDYQQSCFSCHLPCFVDLVFLLLILHRPFDFVYHLYGQFVSNLVLVFTVVGTVPMQACKLLLSVQITSFCANRTLLCKLNLSVQIVPFRANCIFLALLPNMGTNLALKVPIS